MRGGGGGGGGQCALVLVPVTSLSRRAYSCRLILSPFPSHDFHCTDSSLLASLPSRPPPPFFAAFGLVPRFLISFHLLRPTMTFVAATIGRIADRARSKGNSLPRRGGRPGSERSGNRVGTAMCMCCKEERKTRFSSCFKDTELAIGGPLSPSMRAAPVSPKFRLLGTPDLPA